MVEINPAMEEASLTMRADRWTTLWKVTLPLLRPGGHPDEPSARLVATMARPASRILEAAGKEQPTRAPGEPEQLALMVTREVLHRSVRPQGSDHTLVTWLTELALGPEEA